MPLYLFFPLAAAIVYALGSIFIKRALKEGATMDQTFHYTNLILGALFLPLLIFERDAVRWDEGWKVIFMGTAFFVGTWLTFVAIRRGDVSLVTPIMGTKVVFVAISLVVLTDHPPGAALWIASLLTALGIFVMGWGDIRGGKALYFTIFITLCASAMFGVCDALVNEWSADFGAMTFLALGSLGVSLGTVVMWLFQKRPSLKLPVSARFWVWGAGFLIGIQAITMGISLSYLDDATGINVIYASRGLWVIVLVVAFGTVLGNREHKKQGLAFLWRVGGTLLLTAAIVIAVLDRMNPQ